MENWYVNHYWYKNYKFLCYLWLNYSLINLKLIMTLLKIMLLSVVLLIVLINGEYLQYNKTCPNPALPDDLDLEVSTFLHTYIVSNSLGVRVRKWEK